MPPAQKNLSPLDLETKDALLSLPQHILDSEGEAEQKLRQSIEALQQNPETSLHDMCDLFLRYAADKTPQWTPDDHQAMLITKSSIAGAVALDTQAHTPQTGAKAILSTLLHPWPQTEGWRDDAPLLFPVVTDKLFHPALLTKAALQDVFLVGIPTQEGTVHGLKLSPFGQAFHDIAHAFLITNAQNQAFDFGLLSLIVPLESIKGLTFEDQERFGNLAIPFLKNRHACFKKTLKPLCDQEDKKVTAGLFFGIYEIGVLNWPKLIYGRKKIKDPGAFFLSDAPKSFHDYYTNPHQTSPRDGEPRWDTQNPPDFVRKALGIPSTAHVRTRNHGSVLEIDWKIFASIKRMIPTQKGIVQEAQDTRRILEWAGWKPEDGELPPCPRSSDSDTVHEAYLKTIEEGVKSCLNTVSGYFYSHPAKTAAYAKEMEQSGTEFLSGLQESFSEKPYYPKLHQVMSERVFPQDPPPPSAIKKLYKSLQSLGNWIQICPRRAAKEKGA